jgi:hypothetical protein
MYVEEMDEKNLAVFDPSQVKSAIGNNGQFGPTPSIRESRISSPGLFEQADIGINVRSDQKSGLRYADEIIDGNKKYETRDSDSLRPYVGKRIAIVRTGEGTAKAIGEVTVGEPILVNETQFNEMRSEHLVPAGSTFDIKPGSKKYLYPMLNPVRLAAVPMLLA